MSFSTFDSENLMVSYVDQRVGMDALARLSQDTPSEVMLFPFDKYWQPVDQLVAGFSVPPSEPV
jgi:hypothetical protein